MIMIDVSLSPSISYHVTMFKYPAFRSIFVPKIVGGHFTMSQRNHFVIVPIRGFTGTNHTYYRLTIA